MLGYFGGFWDYWSFYHKVTFDGDQRLILVNPGIYELSVKDDIYSSWKEWIQLEDYSKYDAAMRVVGGDPTVGDRSLGATFFLINGWKIRTWEGNHRLVVNGNLYSDDGADPFVDTLDRYKITITLNVSNLVDLMEGSGSSSGGGTTGSGLTQAERDRLFATAQESTLNAVRATVNSTYTTASGIGPKIDTAESNIKTSVAVAKNDINANVDAAETSINANIDSIQSGQAGLTPEQQDMLIAVFRVLGLDPSRPLVVSRTQRTAGTEIQQDISETNGVVTVTRKQ